MRAGTNRIVLLLPVLSCCLLVTTPDPVCPTVGARHAVPLPGGTTSDRVETDARGNLTASQARKVLTRIPGFELKSGAIRVKSVAVNSAAAADVSAEIRL